MEEKPIQPVENKKQLPVTTIAMLFLATAAGFGGGWIGSSARSQNIQTGSTEQRQQLVLNESQVISQLAKDVGPSVVSVNVTSQGAVRSDRFGRTRQLESRSAGTGIILNADGVIVTNRHVVPQGTSAVSVTLSDGTELTEVEVIGRTRENDSLDVAFLKVKDKKGKDLKPARIGDSSKMQVGDKVVAIGNALGQFQNTVTSGILSGFGRTVEAGDETSSETLQNLFQTDASINQGNSGGPLVNISGEVIGINTAVAGGGAENIGFAIPINDVNGLIKSVLEKGKLLRPYLGVRYIILTDDIAFEFNLGVKRGAYIAPRQTDEPILPNSPAAKAGLKEKDIITKVDDQAVDQDNSLISLLGKRSVDDTVTLTVYRDGKEQQIKVTLEAVPQ